MRSAITVRHPVAAFRIILLKKKLFLALMRPHILINGLFMFFRTISFSFLSAVEKFMIAKELER